MLLQDKREKNCAMPCFDGKAEEAMHFYTSVFKNAKIGNVMRYRDAGPGQKGTILSATFELDEQEFIAHAPTFARLHGMIELRRRGAKKPASLSAAGFEKLVLVCFPTASAGSASDPPRMPS